MNRLQPGEILRYCPNEAEGDGLLGRHQYFTRRHRMIVIKTFLGNGRQWHLDKPGILEDEPIGELICTTCGAVALCLKWRADGQASESSAEAGGEE